ncbi:hypothetical protein J2X01_003352 [Arthrobacter ginsengisoli]|uniref:Uncharacterized protein n=1 Tax=Arthrobacter ginsengisoli TaxID=1356565 RepID=A0ABU1UFX3_9MICC|nr:hypothetical protein [Arthrobacter ginsengisoli]MDR7084045.1 hypothetical protein [Arthrobacter ginsengisoli]
MKVFGQRKRAAAAALAAGALLAGLTACTPGNPGTASPGASSVPAAPSADQPSTTAPASPSAEPGTSATVGAMVPGFPEQLLPVMPGAKVVSSSFDKTTTPATAALVGSIQAPSAEVLAFYTQHLLAQGFTAVPGETVGAVPSKDFLRGDNETVNISVLETAGVSTFTIGANVAAESVK